MKMEAQPLGSVPTLPNLPAEKVSPFVVVKFCAPFHFTDC